LFIHKNPNADENGVKIWYNIRSLIKKAFSFRPKGRISFWFLGISLYFSLELVLYFSLYMAFEAFGDILYGSFQNLWGGVIEFIPKFIVAFIIFVLGWLVAVSLGKIVAQILGMLKLDKIFENLGFEGPITRAGFKLDVGGFIGGLVKWFFIVVFLIAAVDVLGLEQVNLFLRDVVAYLPNVIVASFILVIAAVVADTMRRIVVGSAKAAHLPSSELLGGITKWAIWIFAILAAMYQLGIAGPFVQTLFTGFIAALSIALGLSFGLGGKDAAARFLAKLGSDISNGRK